MVIALINLENPRNVNNSKYCTLNGGLMVKMLDIQWSMKTPIISAYIQVRTQFKFTIATLHDTITPDIEMHSAIIYYREK